MTMIRSGTSLCATLALLVGNPGSVAAQTLPLNFEPPDMVVSPICVPRASDADLIAYWDAWDGAALPDLDVGLINRDMRRLAEIDPAAWDETIQRVITLLPGVSRAYTPEHVILAKIEQMIALGQLQELKATDLVQQLLDRGDKNSPKMQYALAAFLGEGIGIERDIRRGEEFLMAAGYGGNADALLDLSHMAVLGNAPEGWNINPQLAVTMAFGSLVGQIDPLICDRIGRIAREYSNGEVVSMDHNLAVRWYRFAADLGDPIAAWRVAEYELQSELITKDNDVLVRYLTKAAEGNLPYAQVALGRIYEAGALVPMDIARAQTLYEAAAAFGDRAGLIRLSGFLEARLPENPELGAEFSDTLKRLSDLDDAPGWVFAKQAARILSDQGRWTGQAEARAVLARGVALDDPAAIMMMAQMDFGTARTEGEFYAAVDSLIHAVTTLGEAGPTADLQAAFLCKAPHAPLLDEANYWAEAEASIGSSSYQFSVAELSQLADNPDPLVMAALQTQALYGRATPLASLLDVLERSGASASTLAFWTDYATRFSNVASARAALALARATTPSARAAALDMFRAAAAAGDTGAPVKLAKALLDDGTVTSRAEALTHLEPLAAKGDGEAMMLLTAADPTRFPTARSVYDAFAPVIEERGDFMAIMLALPFITDAATRDTYRGRAVTAMQCTFPETLAFASALGKDADPAEARRWLTIAAHLVGQDAWQIVELADTFRNLLGAEGEEKAVALYEDAYAMRNRTAVLRLLRLHGNPKAPEYDRNRAVELYADLVAFSEPGQVPTVLADLSRKDPDLRVAVEALLDLDQLYANAAEAGDPTAMREHARRLQVAAVNVEDLAVSTGWLIRASEAGDPAAMVLLSQAYSMGVGVTASLDDARGWLIKAAEAGDETAIEMVKLFTVGQGTN